MRHKNIVRVCILAASAVMIAAGLMSGEFREVLGKAVMICTECIGIG